MADPLDRRFPLFVGLRCMLFHNVQSDKGCEGNRQIEEYDNQGHPIRTVGGPSAEERVYPNKGT